MKHLLARALAPMIVSAVLRKGLRRKETAAPGRAINWRAIYEVRAHYAEEEGHVEEKKLPQRLVRDAGVFYVCHRLSQMGWNARPSMRYAKGPNVVIDSEDGERTWRVKVRSFSKRAPVPLGKDPHIDADWVVVCTGARTDSPRCYVMAPTEVSKLAHRDKRGDSYWLEPPQYDTKEFAER